ncbi:unnamed protein product [Blepharisma stoltei]|uniref:3-hydroxyisobutyryl-CoA hydrolase n=1 Tax=Blepharisma stoltei TaxID=1481888 RepID=A0AAU9JD03_9CILI|nr:unnamed protein product [Blepharisma stoltei]
MNGVLLKEVYGNISKLLINRPRSFNFCDLFLAQALLSEILEAKSLNQHLVLTSSSQKWFCSGADILFYRSNYQEFPQFGILAYQILKNLYNFPNESLSIWHGHSVGYGVGLGMSCRYQLALPSTRWCMPEHHIGIVPNSGTSYFLSHLKDEAFGLYLFLTNQRISGEDCYFSGISTHYMESGNLASFFTDLKTADSLKNLIEKYSSEPNKELSSYLNYKDEINEYFSSPSSIEEILERLKKSNTPFAEQTVKEITSGCPLSLKIAFKQFQLGKNRDLFQAIESEYIIDCNLIVHKNENFAKGVQAKMVERNQGKPSWIPARLEEVTESIIEEHMSIINQLPN